MRLRLRGVNVSRRKRADGTVAVYYYHRATGTPLPGPKGSPEFLSAYAEAEAGRIRQTGTIAEWVRRFEASETYKTYKDSTRAEYRRKLKIVERKWGRLPLSLTQAGGFVRDVLDWREKVADRGKREADNLVGALARVIEFAKASRHVANNPLANIERLYSVDRSEKVWEPQHVLAFTRVARPQLVQALTLAMHTGQRQGDLLRLPWSAYDGLRIRLKQGKTGREVVVRCTEELKAMLDAMPRRGPLILTTSTGRAWKKRHFSQQWHRAATKAGIADLHFHDIRGTTVTLLAEAGCTVPEIAAVTGHTLTHAQRILESYLSRTPALSDAAILKFQTHSRLQSK